jgi:hypothetical protein
VSCARRDRVGGVQQDGAHATMGGEDGRRRVRRCRFWGTIERTTLPTTKGSRRNERRPVRAFYARLAQRGEETREEAHRGSPKARHTRVLVLVVVAQILWCARLGQFVTSSITRSHLKHNTEPCVHPYLKSIEDTREKR